MKDFFDGLLQHIKNDPIELVYSIIVFLLGILVFFLLLHVFLLLRRWLYTSKVKRSGVDFKKVTSYIDTRGKPINRVQRFLLAQFGEIVDISILLSVVIGLLIGVSIQVITETQFSSSVSTLVTAIWLLLFLPFAVKDTIKAVRELIKHGRLLLFAFWCIFTLVYIYFFVVIVKELLSIHF